MERTTHIYQPKMTTHEAEHARLLDLAIPTPSAHRGRRRTTFADGLGWLALVVLVAVLALISGVGPSGSHSSARLNLSSAARLVVVVAVVVGGYLILHA
jgi:hypothetical protein